MQVKTEQHVNPGVDPEKPGIYLWKIEEESCYIGRYTRKNRPLGEYNNNIRKICSATPYRKGKPDKFRKIHLALHDALHQGKKVQLIFLENVMDTKHLNDREKFWIKQLSANLNG